MLLILGLIGVGVSVFILSYHYNKRLLEWLRFQSLGTRDYIVERLSMMFIDIPPHQILAGHIALSVGLGLLGVTIWLPNVVPGLVTGLILSAFGWKAPKPIVRMIYERRVKKFVLQMIDGLNLMSNGLKSGLSIAQAMGLVVQELPNPIREEFSLVLNETKLGVSLEDAFLNLGKRIESDDVEMFVTSVNILKETGGNLAETFDTIVTTIRERIRVERKIDAMTSQGFIQGIFVMAVPPLLGIVFYQTDPEFMKPLFTTPMGWAILLTIASLMIVGFFVIMRIIKIDV